MFSRPIALAAALTFAALGQAAFAQTPPAGGGAGAGPGPGGGMMLPRSAADVAPWADRLFGRLDANQDAAITADELAPLARPEIASRGGGRLRAMISQSDSSRDARVSREELGTGADRMFARMDRNGDGQLGDDELPQPPRPPAPVAIPMPQPADPMPMPETPGG